MKRLFSLLPIAAILYIAGLVTPVHSQARRTPVPSPVSIAETSGVKALLSSPDDTIHSRPTWRILKWNKEADRIAGRPWNGISTGHGNLLTTAGATRLLNLLIGAGGQAMNSTHCRIGSGDSANSAQATDVDLGAAAGSTHRWFQLCDTVAVVNNQVNVQSTFGTADGNFAWAEWGLDLGTASGNTVTAPLFNHKVASSGTKTAGSSWVFQISESMGP